MIAAYILIGLLALALGVALYELNRIAGGDR